MLLSWPIWIMQQIFQCAFFCLKKHSMTLHPVQTQSDPDVSMVLVFFRNQKQPVLRYNLFRPNWTRESVIFHFSDDILPVHL